MFVSPIGMAKTLVTWSSGFIGFHTSKALLERWDAVVGFDNENDYYDINLKQARRHILEWYKNFKFYKWSLENRQELREVFAQENIKKVCNLAAQAGVRYSLENPHTYIQSNLVWFHNLIDLAKEHAVENFVYASSSSVYGANEKIPFSVQDKVDKPMSLYAATKKANEEIAHSYAHLYGMPTTGLRFFTVYGPRGRPDMALFLFADKIIAGKSIDVFNHGRMKRDFTYIDDIVDGIVRCLDNPHPYEIFNLGNDNPNTLEEFIMTIEKHLGKKATKNYKDMQPGDVPATWADLQHTKDVLWREPHTKIDEGVGKFVEWYKEFYGK